MVAHEAAKRYADKGILSYSCNPGERPRFYWWYTGYDWPNIPGNIKTELQRYIPSNQMAFFVRPYLSEHSTSSHEH